MSIVCNQALDLYKASVKIRRKQKTQRKQTKCKFTSGLTGNDQGVSGLLGGGGIRDILLGG